jgi:hypothetical protein
MKSHGTMPEWLGYVICIVVGSTMFSLFWWFTGKALTPRAASVMAQASEQGSTNPLKTEPSPTVPPAPSHNPAHPQQHQKATGTGNVQQQQSNSGGINTQQSSTGDNSPNIVINRSDPRIVRKLDEIKALLDAQQGNKVAPEQLRKKYPLGYVIFDADYQSTVFPYQNKALEEWEFDWRVARVYSQDEDHIGVLLPNLRRKGSGSWMVSGVSIGGIDKKIGVIMNGSGLVAIDGAVLKGEVLAVKPDGIVLLLGFVQHKQKAN